MGVLEEVTQMKNQGMNETDIANSLRGRYSPKEITDAMSQSQIKNAVSNESNLNPPTPQSPTIPQTQGANYSSQPQETYYPTTSQEYYPQEQYAPQEDYSNYSQTSGTDTMIEVAEQVFMQKMQKIEKQINDLTEFRTIAQTQIQMNNERLKRIESTIDKLQAAILNKIGSYADTLNSIKNEMNMMQDSFSKVVKKAVKKK